MARLTTAAQEHGIRWSTLLAVDGGDVDLLPVTAPFDGSLLAEVATCDAGHVDRALESAYRAYRDKHGWLPAYERTGILERAARLMTKEHAELALLASSESGKPLSDVRAEVARAIDTLRLAVNELRTNAGTVLPTGATENRPGRLAFTQFEPLGVVVALNAFNQPFDLVVHRVAAAVAAGCPVIARPAPETPLSCLRVVQLLHQAGLARDRAQVVVTADPAVAERLATDPRVGLLSFAGPADLGWRLRSRLARGTRCLLEHGGAAPVLLAEDADRDLALQAVLRGGFYHAGQVGVAVQKVYAPRRHARAFAEALAARAERLQLGDPTEGRTDVGPLIHEREVARVHAWVQEALGAGAVRLCGGRARDTNSYECTVLLDPPPQARVSREEIAGPVIGVHGYDHIDGAVRAVNDLPTIFQGSVFTRDIDLAMRVCRSLDVSTAVINGRGGYRSNGLPFAGLRESGMGTTGMPHAIREMQIQKLTILNTAR